MPGVLHVPHGEVVVKVVIEIERLVDVLRFVVGKLDAGLLPPEQVRHQADEAGLREFVRVAAHGVVDAPDFHDGDDGAGGRTVGDREIASHLAVAQLDPDIPRLHADARAAACGGSLRSLASSNEIQSLAAKPRIYRPNHVKGLAPKSKTGALSLLPRNRPSLGTAGGAAYG